MMIRYEKDNPPPIKMLAGFFRGWSAPPTPEILTKLLNGSYLVLTAHDGDELAGFLTAVSDGAMHAFVTLLEVRESHKGRGIGSELLKLAKEHYYGFYDIALTTDPDTGPFYEKNGFSKIFAMHLRDFDYIKKS